MKLTITLLLLLGVAAQVSLVNAVACSSNSDCTATDYVTATCTSSVCVCESGYVAVDSGCAAKYPKPTITTNGGEAAEAIEGETVTLRCGGTSTTYAWYKDGSDNAETETTNTITHLMETADVQFECTEGSGDLASEKSDAFTVTYLASGATSSATPTITLQSSKVANGKPFTVTCTGAPFGATIDVTDPSDSSLASPFSQPTAPAGRSVQCTFTSKGISFPNSPGTKSYPTLATGVEKAIVTSSNTDGQTVFRLNVAPTLTCTTEPAKAYLPNDPQRAYSWTASGLTPNPSGEKWTPTEEHEYADLTCTAGGVESDPYPITIKNDYLKKPTVTTTPETPLDGARVSLTCKYDESVKDVVVSWSKDKTKIENQHDKTIQYEATNAPGTYECSIAKNGFVATSDSKTVTLTPTMTKPVVVGAGDVGRFGSVELECSSVHAFPGLIYSWARGGTDLKAAEAKYTITDVKKDGKYTCTTKFGKLEEQSDEVEVKVIEPGRTCTTNDDCKVGDKEKKAYTGTCDTKAKRCACSNGYFQAGDICQNGVSQVVGSLLLVTVASVIARLF